MISAILNDFFQHKLDTKDPEEKFITSGVGWQAYEKLVASLGDSSCYRVAYLSGTLEIISLSRNHEFDKENIGRLLEEYFIANRIRFWGLGSTTFRREDKQAGKEPDKSYCIGTDKEFPDLAIEVVYTSGGVDTLEIYKRLGIREVWFWHNSQFQVYCLQDNEYQQQSSSQLLPDLDLSLLAQYVTIKDPLEAMIQWREQIKVG